MNQEQQIILWGVIGTLWVIWWVCTFISTHKAQKAMDKADKEFRDKYSHLPEEGYGVGQEELQQLNKTKETSRKANYLLAAITFFAFLASVA